jgi:outer membrane receptor protein involved in Fe transport
LRDGRGRPAEYRSVMGDSPPTEVPHSSYHAQSVLAAVFAQVLYAPWHWLTLNLGLRLDIDSTFGSRLSPRAALIVTPHRDSSLRASYAEAFRSPTALELHQSDGTYVIRPSDLGPELVRTAELEWQQRIQKLSVSVRAFAAFYENLIAQRSASADAVARAQAAGELVSTADPSWIVQNANVQGIRSYGGSLTVQVRPVAGLTIAGSTTVSRSSSEAAVLTLWPRAFGNARIAYEFWKEGPTLALSARYARRRRAFNDFDQDTALVHHPAPPPELDLRLTVSSPVRRLSGLSIRGGVGVRVFPEQPYLLTLPTVAAPASPVQYMHDLPQLHVLLGARYDF